MWERHDACCKRGRHAPGRGSRLMTPSNRGGDFPVIKWRGRPYRIVKPWFDHPPLYSAFMGSWMTLLGFHDIFAVDLLKMRMASLLLFAATFWLLWLVLRHYLDEKRVLLSLALFATSPLAVIQGRLVISENFFLGLYLGAYYLLLLYDQRPSRKLLLGVALLCAALALSKIAALALVLHLVAIALLRRNLGLFAVICIGTVCGVGLYIGYGAYFNANLFFATLSAHSARWSGLGGFYQLLFVPQLISKRIYLPFLLGFVTLIANLLERRQIELSLAPLLCGLGMAFFVDQNAVLAWYSDSPLSFFGLRDRGVSFPSVRGSPSDLVVAMVGFFLPGPVWHFGRSPPRPDMVLALPVPRRAVCAVALLPLAKNRAPTIVRSALVCFAALQVGCDIAFALLK